MSRITSKNSKAEKIVFKHLRQNKIYSQKHYSKIPGKPDIALPRKRKIVFIDGDFWHGRYLSKTLDRLPVIYWRDKILSNVKRDRTLRKKLRKDGWEIIRVWESDIIRKRTQQAVLERIVKFLRS